MLAEGGFAQASLGDIAARADVCRATLYNRFGSRQAIVRAVLEDLEDRDGLAQALGRGEEGGIAEALAGAIGRLTSLYAREHQLLRQMVGLAAVDAEVDSALAAWDEQRRLSVAHLADRLVEEDRLRPGLTRRRAVDCLWLLTSFGAFDQLFGRRAMSLRTSGEVLIDLAAQGVMG